jgi:tetratricopeptide (TPR) repeat protein
MLALLVLAVLSVSRCYRVCLSAIVKDEEKVIVRFLTNNKYAFDRFDITDTGSTDKTVNLTTQFFEQHRLSGQVHYFAWVDDFGKAKSYALERSKEQGCEHIVFLDADEEMWSSKMKPLTSAEQQTFFRDMDRMCPVVCNAQIYSHGAKWWRSFAIAGNIKESRFFGSRHEYVDSANHGPTTYLENYYVNARRDQTRHDREKNSLILDGLALERDAAKGVNVGRSLYYAGQSYEQGGDLERALTLYRKRVKSDGWNQEKFIAQLRIGIILQNLNGFNESIAAFFDAMKIDDTRSEPYYYLAKGFRNDENFMACYMMAKEGALKKISTDHLFADENIFTVAVHDEAAVCSSYLPQYRVESLEYFIYLNRKQPNDLRIRANLLWVNSTLFDAYNKAMLPSSAARTKLLKLWRQ